jgi:hypothetical protein
LVSARAVGGIRVGCVVAFLDEVDGVLSVLDDRIVPLPKEVGVLCVVVEGLCEPTSIETHKTLIETLCGIAQETKSVIDGLSSGRIPSIVQ